MGVYRAAIVTESGQNLIAQALANETPLIFTSAKTSSYSYPVGTNVPALTGLQDVVQSVMPFDSKVLGGNVAQVSVRFDNDGVDQTYRIETIGLYAKIEGGTETLFSVTQATTPDEMPVQSDVSPSAYIYNIQHTVQNASQITLTVNPAGTATVQDIMDIESPEFDDSGTVEGISSFPSFLETMKSKMNFFQFFRNLKAGLQFVLHTGQIVNNCVTDNSSLPLSAAQGKVLKDLYTQLYSDKVSKSALGKFLTVSGSAQAKEGSYVIVTSIKLPAGHTYLVIGSNQASKNLTSIISSQLAGFNSEAEIYSFYLGDSRTTGTSGGGCLCAAIVSTKAECTISLQGYGYSSGTYDYIGKLFAIQLA